MSATIHEPITTLEQLRRIIAEPDDDVKRIEIPALDEHCRAFIARSPFVFLATSNAAGDCDVSPKGDAPGFVHVIDDRTLLIRDRKGNRRADSLRRRLELKGNVPDLAIVVGVEDAYMHCPRCVLRAGLWDTRSWMPKDEQPSWAAAMRDHMKYDDVPLKLFEQALDAHNRDLY